MIKVVSFSLFLTKKENIDFYSLGLLENVEIINKFLPDWLIYIYYDITVSPDFINYLENLKCICFKCNKTHNWIGTFWRFYPLENNNVDIFISRDADSRITLKEINTINKWLESNKTLFLLRGHKSHIQICAGLWGIKKHNFNNSILKNTIDTYINKFKTKYTDKEKHGRLCPLNGVDQEFLYYTILPLFKNDILGFCEKSIKKYDYEIELENNSGNNFFGSRQNISIETKEKYKHLSVILHKHFSIMVENK
jgi:hypothetical protein